MKDAKTIFIIILFCLLMYTISPLLIPLLMGIVFAVLLYPAFERIQSRKLSPSVSAMLVTFAFTVLVVVPAVLIIYRGVSAGYGQVQSLTLSAAQQQDPSESLLTQFIYSPNVQQLLSRISRILPVDAEELITSLSDLATRFSVKLADLLGNVLTRLPLLLVGFFVMVVSLYFYLVDGKLISQLIQRVSFLSTQQTAKLMESFQLMCRSVVWATVFSASIQTFIYLIALVIVGFENLALSSLLIFFASFVPLIGSTPITFGISLIEILQGNTKAGLVLLVVAVFISFLDNLIRAWVIKGKANLHPLLSFAAAFGGIQVFGISGIFLGPIVAGIFVVAFDTFYLKPKS